MQACSVPKEAAKMGYRKVSSLEQLWYLIRFRLKELFRKEVKNEHKTTEE